MLASRTFGAFRDHRGIEAISRTNRILSAILYSVVIVRDVQQEIPFNTGLVYVVIVPVRYGLSIIYVFECCYTNYCSISTNVRVYIRVLTTLVPTAAELNVL
jgi:hypothetical protein